MALKVLLADDNITAQKMGCKILTDAGYTVVPVSNGAAAVKKIASEKPDLLILDVFMPGYTGLEVCDKVKSSVETARLPVLLTVTSMEPYSAADGNRVRADGVLIKPFEATDLLSVLHKFEEKLKKTAQMAPAEFEATTPEADNEQAATEDTVTRTDSIPQDVAAEPALGIEELEAAPEPVPTFAVEPPPAAPAEEAQTFAEPQPAPAFEVEAPLEVRRESAAEAAVEAAAEQPVLEPPALEPPPEITPAVEVESGSEPPATPELEVSPEELQPVEVAPEQPQMTETLAEEFAAPVEAEAMPVPEPIAEAEPAIEAEHVVGAEAVVVEAEAVVEPGPIMETENAVEAEPGAQPEPPVGAEMEAEPAIESPPVEPPAEEEMSAPPDVEATEVESVEVRQEAEQGGEEPAPVAEPAAIAFSGVSPEFRVETAEGVPVGISMEPRAPELAEAHPEPEAAYAQAAQVASEEPQPDSTAAVQVPEHAEEFQPAMEEPREQEVSAASEQAEPQHELAARQVPGDMPEPEAQQVPAAVAEPEPEQQAEYMAEIEPEVPAEPAPARAERYLQPEERFQEDPADIPQILVAQFAEELEREHAEASRHSTPLAEHNAETQAASAVTQVATPSDERVAAAVQRVLDRYKGELIAAIVRELKE